MILFREHFLLKPRSKETGQDCAHHIVFMDADEQAIVHKMLPAQKLGVQLDAGHEHRFGVGAQQNFLVRLGEIVVFQRGHLLGQFLQKKGVS